MGIRTVEKKRDPRPAGVRPDNFAIAQEYLDHLRAARCPSGKLENIVLDVRSILQCIEDSMEGTMLDELRYRDVVRMRIWMTENACGYKIAAKRAVKTLIDICHYLSTSAGDEHPGSENFMFRLFSDNMWPAYNKKPCSTESLQDLARKMADRDDEEIACAIMLAVLTGCGKETLMSFRVDDFSPGSGNGSYYFAQGKNNKVWYVPREDFEPYLQKWMKKRKARLLNSEWLFPIAYEPDKHIDLNTINRWSELISEKLGERFYWHDTRHSKILALRESGLSDRMVIQLIYDVPTPSGLINELSIHDARLARKAKVDADEAG